jgi:hypothetical protein
MDDVAGQLQALQGSILRLDAELLRAHADRERLERALRVTRLLALIALVLCVLAPLFARWLPITFRSVHARELVVQDASGKPKITLAAQDDSASMYLRAPSGGIAIEMKSDALDNLLALYSRAEKPSTGIRLDSWKDRTALTMQHQQAPEGADNLSGWVSVESNLHTGSQMTMHAADGGYLKLEGSIIKDVGANFTLRPGPRKDQPSTWLSLESMRGLPSLSMHSMSGEELRLGIAHGPEVDLRGPFNGPSGYASLAFRGADKGPTLMLSGPGNSIFGSTGKFARLMVSNGIEDDQNWATPLPKAK